MNKSALGEFIVGVGIGAAAIYFLKKYGLVTFIDRVDPNTTTIIGGGGHY